MTQPLQALLGFNCHFMSEDPSGWTDSAQAWIKRIDSFDFARQVLLDGPMLRMCSDLPAKKILDVGCGEGRFCRMLSQGGARTVGLDPTEKLLAAARMRDPAGTYHLGSGEKLPYEDESFDVVVFYLTLIDIPDFRQAIKEGARVLKSGGRMVIGNIACHASTHPSGWVKDAEGRKLYYPIDHYCDEFGEEVAWAGIKVINYHRPLGAYMEAFLGSGLILREYLEPAPSKDEVKNNPELEFERRVPYLVAMLWEKPA